MHTPGSPTGSYIPIPLQLLPPAAGTQGHSATSPFPPGHPWAKVLGWRSPEGSGLPHNCDLFLAPLQEGFRGSFEVMPNLLAGN